MPENDVDVICPILRGTKRQCMNWVVSEGMARGCA